MTIKRILVPTDFSKCAERAAHAAVNIAGKAGAELFFLHIHEDKAERNHLIHTEQHHDPEIGHAKDQLNKVVSIAEHAGLKAFPLFATYSIADERIENYIDPNHIDLVVMGSHGNGGIREWVTGSTTQQVVNHSPAPVLVIKEQPLKSEIDNILFACTFEKDETKPFAFIADFAGLFNAKLHILHLNMPGSHKDDKDVKALIENVMSTFPQVFYTINTAETNDAQWGILQSAKRIESSLLAIAFQKFSDIKKLINQAETSVMIVKYSK